MGIGMEAMVDEGIGAPIDIGAIVGAAIVW
jgi:hypothetical protein